MMTWSSTMRGACRSTRTPGKRCRHPHVARCSPDTPTSCVATRAPILPRFGSLNLAQPSPCHSDHRSESCYEAIAPFPSVRDLIDQARPCRLYQCDGPAFFIWSTGESTPDQPLTTERGARARMFGKGQTADPLPYPSGGSRLVGHVKARS